MGALRGVRVAGTGSCLPERVVTNDDLAQVMDTSDEWIRTRTGISERRFLEDGQGTSAVALPAAQAALEAAGVSADEVDFIVCCTMTPDFVMPTLAALLQRGLGAENAGGFDLNSACSGFVYGMVTAAGLVRSGAARKLLLVGAEKMSGITDPQERSTRVIFGDGAGAVLLEGCEPEQADLLASITGLKGDDHVLTLPGGGSRNPASPETLAGRQHYVRMRGRETFKFAVKTFVSLIKDTCAQAEISPEQLAVIVPHQVNQRILEAACSRAGIGIERCHININRVGNTSAASVSIALDEAVRSGRIKRGDYVLLAAFGGGLSWGSALLRW